MELQKCFCFHAKPFHQWRGPYKLEQFWSLGSREIIFSLLSPSSQKFQFVITLPFHQNLPRKLDLQGILKVLLLLGPVLPPMERSIKVGTILELWFTRNNIFAAFPVIQKFQFVITLPFHRNLPPKSDIQGILKLLLIAHPAFPPMGRSIQVGSILEPWFRRNNIFAAFPVIPKNPISCHTTSPSKPSGKVGFSRNFESVFARTPSPSTNGEVHTCWNNFRALVDEKLCFRMGFPILIGGSPLVRQHAGGVQGCDTAEKTTA